MSAQVARSVTTVFYSVKIYCVKTLVNVPRLARYMCVTVGPTMNINRLISCTMNSFLNWKNC